MNQRRFELHLPGLLKVLAEHLYSSKKVGVRELLQNAHDSCIRRRLEEKDPDYEPRITLSLQPRQRLLTIIDNGSGMTEEEIGSYLATIGRGYTREMRERLSFSSPEEASELIGQFGLGFLSAFLLAEEVKVVTRSFRGGPALLWESRGDENYTLTDAKKGNVGTTVTLRVKPAASFVLQKALLLESVRNFADFLPIPIHWQDDDEPINLMQAPWEADDPEQAILAFIQRVFHDKHPLAVFPLRNAKVSLGHDSLTVPMNGFVYVPAVSVASVREFGDMRVYIRRMFICDRQEHLLPPWARFVRGLIDCPVLQPTASREDIHQDDYFDSVRQALEEQLSQELRKLARSDPPRWKNLVRCHTDVILGWAVRDNDFFDQVKDIVALRTSRGLLTMPEYLKLSGGTLYYVTRELGSLQEQLLAEGRDVPAIDASWFSVEPFLEKYAAAQRKIKRVQLDGEADELLRPAPERPLAPLLAWYAEQGIAARVAAFEPKDIPALMIYPPDAELMKASQDALNKRDDRDKDALSKSMAPLVRMFVSDRLDEETHWQGTLCLNASCPFLKNLAKKQAAPALPSVLRLLYQHARLFCGRLMSPAEAAQAYAEFTRSLQEIVP